MSALRPGGWIEQLEFSLSLLNNERTPLSEDNPILRLQKLLIEASKITGRPLNVCEDMHTNLERAGFLDVSSRTITCPIGRWPRDKGLKPLGQLALHYWLELLEDLCLVLMNRFLEVSGHIQIHWPPGADIDPLQWDMNEIRAFLESVRGELLKRGGHLVFKVVVAYGRRPL